MKVSAKRIASLFTLLFLGGILATAWMLYKLPENLIYRASVIDMKELELVNPLLNEINMVVGLVMILGVLAIITLINNQKNTDEAKTSVAENLEATKEEKEKVENEEEIEEIFREVDLDQINSILAEKEDNKLKLNNVLNKICNHIEAVQGALYVASKEGSLKYIELVAAYAYHRPESEVIRYEYGEGLAGQVAKEGKLVNIEDVPSGYIKVMSGLGSTSPNHLLIIPMKKGNQVIGVVEIASFKSFRKSDVSYLEQVFSLAAEKTFGESKPKASGTKSANAKSTGTNKAEEKKTTEKK